MRRAAVLMTLSMFLASASGGAQEPISANEQYDTWKRSILSHQSLYDKPSDQQFAAVIRRLDSGEVQLIVGMVGSNFGYDIYVQPLRINHGSGPEEKCEGVGEVVIERIRGGGQNRHKVTEKRLKFPINGGANAVEIRVRLDTIPTKSPEMRLVLPLLPEARFGLRSVTDAENVCEM